MYIPSTFRETDRARLRAFMAANSFALLLSRSEQGVEGSHLPFLFDDQTGPEGSLYGHMARANPQWRRINGDVLVVFSGPHAYISPTWYSAAHVVPTWNYQAVHVHGSFTLVTDGDELLTILRRTVAEYESALPAPWSFDGNDPFIRKLLEGIVGFRIEISGIEGKWKMSQNQPPDRRKGVISELFSLGNENQKAIAEAMRELA